MKPKACKVCKERFVPVRSMQPYCTPKCEVARKAVKPVRSSIKRKAPKRRPGHNKAMLDACRGQHCWLNVKGVCLGAAGIETVVPCHANWSEYGKGMGLKAADKYTVPGCAACHSWLDQSGAGYEEKKEVWEMAYMGWDIERRVL